jgi:hypothetical protein
MAERTRDEVPTIEDYQDDLVRRGLQQMLSGQVVVNDEVIKRLEKKLSKSSE